MTTKKQRENCAKLADLLETIPDNQFKMSDWCKPSSNVCKTSGCALGWAAMSGEFPFGWGVKKEETFDHRTNTFKYTWAKTLEEANKMLMKNGEFMIVAGKNSYCPDDAGDKFFGETATNDVFLETWLDKSTVLARLREIAKTGEISYDIYD